MGRVPYRATLRPIASPQGRSRMLQRTCCLIAVASLFAAARTATAIAAVPAWTITSVSGPTNFSAADSTGKYGYLITAVNTGGAPTTGPVTLTDNLPPGLTLNPTGSLNGFFAQDDGHPFREGITCAEGPPPTCTDPNPIQPGQAIFMAVPVNLAPGLPPTVTNTATVEGGEAPAASASDPTSVSAAPLPFGFQVFDTSATSPDGTAATHAGSHPYSATTSLIFNSVVDPRGFPGFFPIEPVASPKLVTVNLPAGTVVNPTATPRCTESQLETDLTGGGCPDSSAVGTVRGRPGEIGLSTILSPLYNMVPPPGTPASLAFDLSGAGIYIHLVGKLRTGGDYGLSASSSDILEKGHITSIAVELWGNPSDTSHDGARGQCVLGLNGHSRNEPCPVPRTKTAFLTLPSACSGPLTTQISANSWQDPATFVSASSLSNDPFGNPVGVTGCSTLDFSPTLTVQPEATATDSPTGLHVDLHMPQSTEFNGLAEANLKRAVVTLPAGITVNPAAADGLQACSSAQIDIHGPGPATCPEASKIGTVEVDTPLLEHPLPGGVYLAKQGDNPFNSLLAMYIAIDDPATGVVVKLAGHVAADPVTGQLTTTFDENPQLPFSDLKLVFFGGPRAALATPETCGGFTTSSALSSWAAADPNNPTQAEIANPGDSFTINSGPNGTGCVSAPAQRPFSPGFAAGTAIPLAAAFSQFALKVSRADGQQNLTRINTTLPAGLLAKLAGVARCPDSSIAGAAANTGTAEQASPSCPAASQIGTLNAASGVGADPLVVPGKVYLAGPYKGAPFSLAFVIPALAGPFDLGTVVVRATISVDPTDAHVTVNADPFPTILQGIPIHLRSASVRIDRPDFTFNPTSCTPTAITAQVFGSDGASASPSSRFQAVGCANLPFRPTFQVSTQAKTSKANGASLDVKVAQNPGEANIHKVDVSLPLALPSRLTTLQKACAQAQFEANPASCPEGSFVGTATAHTPVLATPLTGPALLVSHGGAAFPDLVLLLQGEGIRIDLIGNTDIKKGITFSRFETVPDAPISSFELTLPEGPHSALAASKNLCALTKTTTVRKRITRHIHGRTVHAFKNVKHTVADPLMMPTTITGQNGAVVGQTTKITVSGCPKHKAKKRKKSARKHKKASHKHK